MRTAIFSLLSIVLAGTGCGFGGLPQYSINGEVTYGGEPIPSGVIRFQPDKEAGNDWKARVAEIHDGKYSIPSSSGVIGGAYLVIVFGHDGIPYEDSEGTNKMGKSLFEAFTKQVDLPRSSSTLDIDVPRK